MSPLSSGGNNRIPVIGYLEIMPIRWLYPASNHSKLLLLWRAWHAFQVDGGRCPYLKDMFVAHAPLPAHHICTHHGGFSHHTHPSLTEPMPPRLVRNTHACLHILLEKQGVTVCSGMQSLKYNRHYCLRVTLIRPNKT